MNAFGSSQTSADAIYLARHVGLRCGVPIEVPALAVNRLCGSGFQAVANGAQVSMHGTAQVQGDGHVAYLYLS